MIIAISGKSGSGKDTLGVIIQGLILGFKHEEIKEHILKKNNYNNYNNFIIVKIASKIKKIVCEFLNCSLEDLESQSFKNNPIPGEQTKLTPRDIMISIGSLGGSIRADFWVSEFLKNYKEIDLKITDSSICDNCDTKYIYTEKIYCNWIITDLRFLSELKLIKRKVPNNILIRITRDEKNIINHISETDLDNYDNWDYIIDNDSNISDLIFKAEKILKIIKLI